MKHITREQLLSYFKQRKNAKRLSKEKIIAEIPIKGQTFECSVEEQYGEGDSKNIGICLRRSTPIDYHKIKEIALSDGIKKYTKSCFGSINMSNYAHGPSTLENKSFFNENYEIALKNLEQTTEELYRLAYNHYYKQAECMHCYLKTDCISAASIKRSN